MNSEEQYVLINQDNQYYQEFDVFTNLPIHTNTIYDAHIYITITDAKQAIKDIKEWTSKNKRRNNTYVIAKIIVSVEIIEDNN
jgi:hypothetical protein